MSRRELYRLASPIGTPHMDSTQTGAGTPYKILPKTRRPWNPAQDSTQHYPAWNPVLGKVAPNVGKE